MNILFVSPEIFYPANTGGKLAILQHFQALCRNKDHNIYLFCISNYEPNQNVIKYFLQYCKKVQFVNRKCHKIISLFNSVFLPYSVGSRSFRQIKKEFNRMYEDNNIDLIFYEFPQMAKLGYKYKTKKIICFHNVEYQTLFNISKNQGNILKRLIYKIDSLKLYFYEKKLYKKRFDKYLFLSPLDLQFYVKEFGLIENKCELLPPGFIKRLNNSSKLEENTIGFIANYKYAPNEDGILWFVNNVFPIILEKNKNVKLYIVGRSPSEKIVALKSDDIIVTGEVNDLDEYYSRLKIVINPIRSGGGVKMKLIEATSYGKLIISTSFGILGSMYNEHSIIIADEPDDFANKCLDTITNYDKYVSYLQEEEKTFDKYYNVEALIKNINNNIKEL